MSTLLRALMAQQSGGDKPNLATVTDSGVLSFNNLEGRSRFWMHVMATLEKGKEYDVSFDVDCTVSIPPVSDSYIRVTTAYSAFGSNLVMNLDTSIGSSSRSYHNKYRANGSGDVGLLDGDINKTAGSIRIYNLFVTEA